MGLQLVTAPTAEPVTLAQAKAHLRVTGADDDALIAGYLLAARRSVEAYTRRVMVTQTWDFIIDYDWPTVDLPDYLGPRITLPLPPLQSVTSVSYVDTAGTSQTLASTQYRVDSTGQEGIIEPAYNVTWPSVREQRGAITVRFVAGYDSTNVPETLQSAILLTVGDLYEHRESVVTGTTATELPRSAQFLLFPHRVFY